MSIPSQPGATPAQAQTEFDRLRRVWRHQQALWDVAIYNPALVGDLAEDENEKHCNETDEALRAFLAHPATNARQLAIKLRTLVEQEAYLSREARVIMRQLVSDAEELAKASKGSRTLADGGIQ